MTQIKFPQQQLVIESPSGKEFQELQVKYPEIPIKFGCRNGACGTCAIQVIAGHSNLTKQSEEEKQTLRKIGLDETCHRLACQCAFNGSVTITEKETTPNK